jgi:hypothetical protein
MLEREFHRTLAEGKAARFTHEIRNNEKSVAPEISQLRL